MGLGLEPVESELMPDRLGRPAVTSGKLGDRHVVVVVQSTDLLPVDFADHEALLRASGPKVGLRSFGRFDTCQAAPPRVESAGDIQ